MGRYILACPFGQERNTPSSVNQGLLQPVTSASMGTASCLNQFTSPFLAVDPIFKAELHQLIACCQSWMTAYKNVLCNLEANMYNSALSQDSR